MDVLIVDFMDSFTFNLQHLLEAEGASVRVVRIDQIRHDDLPVCDKLILSPGPGLPAEYPFFNLLCDHYCSRIPVLGVCLGMQGLAQYYGGDVYNLGDVRHGVGEKMLISADSPLFNGLGSCEEIGLYHSWAVKEPLPAELTKMAADSEGVVMAFCHRNLPVYGVQFHPESVLTPGGRTLLKNFLEI